jgi:hypothetical protein
MIGNTRKQSSLLSLPFVFLFCVFFLFNRSCENIGIIIGLFCPVSLSPVFRSPFPCLHALPAIGEGFRLSTVELDEYIVPDLDHLRMICIHQSFAVNFFSFFIGPAVNMDFSAGSAGAGIAHFPEIIFFISKRQDPVFAIHFFHSAAASSSFGRPSLHHLQNGHINRSFGIFKTFVSNSQLHSIASFLK